jgi:hypothetical protein
MWRLQLNPNFSRWLNPETPTQVKGQTLPGSQFLFLKKTGSPIQFSVMRRANQDAQVMPGYL